MKQKNNKVTLLFLLVVGIGLLGGVSWWVLQLIGGDIRPVTSAVKQKNPPTSLNLESDPLKGLQDNANSTNTVPTGLFSYGGSTTWSPIRETVASYFQKDWPQFQLRYTEHPNAAPGSGTGINMLLNDELAFAQSSRSLTTNEYQQAIERGFKLKQIPVALDGVVVAVNPTLSVKGLTLNQLQGIYTGKIRNWQQVGGPNLGIRPYSRPLESGGTVDYFRDTVLQKQGLGGNVQFVRDTTQGLRRVGKEPGALYYASASTVIQQCTVKGMAIGKNAKDMVSPYVMPLVPEDKCPQQRNQINREAIKSGKYPLTRRLFVVVKENCQGDEQAGNAYVNLLLTKEGQDLIEKAGFVKIR
ncbi:MAG: PstS family phosphate ABC transporter substrate-binding protein [Microcystaceae cyanobacterium]